MSIQDDREIRARLGVSLGSIEPGPAPVTGVMRRGKAIRKRRRISVAAGLAVVVLGAALIPGFLQSQRPVPSAPLKYKVTVSHLRARARAGVIGAGVTDGRRWQVRLSGRSANPTIDISGLPMMGADQGPAPSGWPASLEEASSSGRRSDAMIAGTVTHRVTRLTISLPDGELVSLAPVSWGGHRWVAVVIPSGVRIVRAVAYAGTRELAYSVPFGTDILATWWRPGQVPPQRVTRLIGAGRASGIAWRYMAEIGPWGYCYAVAGGSACYAVSPQRVPSGTVISGMTCGTLAGANSHGTAISGLAAAASDVRTVVLRYSDASTATFPATEVDGSRLVAYAIPAHLTVVSSVEYGAAGQVIGRTAAKPWAC